MDYSQHSDLFSAMPTANHAYGRSINEVHTDRRCRYERYEQNYSHQKLYIWKRYCVCRNYREISEENIQAILKDPHLEKDGLVGTFDKNYVIKPSIDEGNGYFYLRSMTKNAQVPFGPGDTDYNEYS